MSTPTTLTNGQLSALYAQMKSIQAQRVVINNPPAGLSAALLEMAESHKVDSSELDAYYDQAADWTEIPSHMRGAICRYVMYGIMPGSFLEAVFANDLMRAAGCADATNITRLSHYATFLANWTPSGCNGSYEAVNNWIDTGGMNGRKSPTPSEE